ncbi:MAG: amidohydrolase family protein [Planctomycetota bacterium]
MIVDLHTRVWSQPEELGPAIAAQFRRRRAEPWEQADGSPERFAEAMAPVDRAVLLGFEAARLGASISAERVAEHVSANPEKYLGFAGIDPTVAKAPARLEAALDLGLVGAVVAPAAAGFHPTDTRAMELFELCQSRHIPVLIESSGLMAREARLEFDQPHLLDEVARECPDLKLVLGSLGDPWTDEALALLAKHPTVYADLSGLVSRPWRLMNILMSAYQQDVMSQLLFGSNFPWFTPEQAIVNLYSVNTFTQGTHLPSVPREQLRSVVERDTLAVLGIDHAPAEPGSTAASTQAPQAPQTQAAEAATAEPSTQPEPKLPDLPRRKRKRKATPTTPSPAESPGSPESKQPAEPAAPDTRP